MTNANSPASLRDDSPISQARRSLPRVAQRPARSCAAARRRAQKAAPTITVANKPQPASSTCGQSAPHVTDRSMAPKPGKTSQLAANNPSKHTHRHPSHRHTLHDSPERRRTTQQRQTRAHCDRASRRTPASRDDAAPPLSLPETDSQPGPSLRISTARGGVTVRATGPVSDDPDESPPLASGSRTLSVRRVTRDLRVRAGQTRLTPVAKDSPVWLSEYLQRRDGNRQPTPVTTDRQSVIIASQDWLRQQLPPIPPLRSRHKAWDLVGDQDARERGIRRGICFPSRRREVMRDQVQSRLLGRKSRFRLHQP